MTIIDYVLIVDNASDSLRHRVRGMIDLGWQPLGGVSIAQTDDGLRFAQAMVKYAEEI